MKKLKEYKGIQWIISIRNRIREAINRSFADTDRGSIVLSCLGMVFLWPALLQVLLPILPIGVCVLLTAALLLLAGELLGLLFSWIFGGKRRSRVYGLLLLLSLLLYIFASIQGESSKLCLLAALPAAWMISLFGRCLSAFIRHKRCTALLIISVVSSVALFAGIAFFLGSEGFRKNYIKDYLFMAEKDKDKRENLSLAGAANGEYRVAALTYGTDEERNIPSATYDLTPFASQGALDKLNRKHILGYDLSKAPLEGKIWYPLEQQQCPVLFIIHGNHQYTVDSYLGYDYLGEYLASFGYVVISVNENVCNELSNENDARAVLLLENIKYILDQNRREDSMLYRMIAEDKIAVAGHSRGGEAVSTAVLFNDYENYPEDGNVKFSYHFSLPSVLAIAPTVDQYTPAGREVALKDVNYMIIHGANDQDVTKAMGQKQYFNVSFTGDGDYIKTMLYVSGANHGQFNQTWGRYDSAFPMKLLLNVASLMEETKQQDILKIFVKTFLDVTLKKDRTDERLLKECTLYADDLPETVYQQMYQTSRFTCFADFEQDSDLHTGSRTGIRIETEGLSQWTEERTVFGLAPTKENYAMKAVWEDTTGACIRFLLPEWDFTGRKLVFDLADMSEKAPFDALPDVTVTLEDAFGNRADLRIQEKTAVYPTLPVRLGKLDYLFGTYEYKHPFQTITLPAEAFEQADRKLDMQRIVKITMTFGDRKNGSVRLDNVGLE